MGHPFHITLFADRNQLDDQEILSFIYQLPSAWQFTPALGTIPVSEISIDGRLVFYITGNDMAARGTFGVTSENYEAYCEIDIAEQACEKDPEPLLKTPPVPDRTDDSRAMFRGYELRNLGNDIDRAVYSAEERLILINTEAPTVRLYVDRKGLFTDGARLLLAELLLDVITDEMARCYINNTSQNGQKSAYHRTKQNMIRHYGVEIHSILLNERFSII